MHTESDACKLWCPMVRLGEADSTDNRSASAGFIKNDEPGAGVKWNCCIASACMMWRWVTTLDGDKGYCGLAGVPK